MNIDTEFLRPTLDQLAHQEPIARLWTDKRTRREGDGDYVLHGYTPFYDREFSKWRDEPIRILEIGLNVGASIKLWLEYFTQAKIVGMDIIDFKFAPEIEKFIVDNGLLNRFEFIKGNAFSPYDLQRFVENQEMFDIIIDDGAHSSGTIVMSFQYLWAKVKPGGYYCIEDFRECVNNPESHTPGFPDQIQFAETLLGKVLLGERDVEEAHVSKELLILRKK
jgi:methyltransferase family protein